VRPSRPQPRGMRELLETILWLKRSLLLRPRNGALRGGLSQPATTGNFGIRVQMSGCVYIVHPKSGRHYGGSTRDPIRRRDHPGIGRGRHADASLIDIDIPIPAWLSSSSSMQKSWI